MDVRFAEYRFVREQLTLYKQQEIIELKHTQALLLDFFLADPDTIHSKEVIMDSVWQGKVVSEQVVFQTISQLRAIFGSEAIKTFSKKGYQWQLTIEHELAQTHKPLLQKSTIQPSDAGIISDKAQKKMRPKWLLAAGFLALSVVFYLVFSVSSNEQVILHLVGDGGSSKAEPSVIKALGSNEAILASDFEVRMLTKPISASQAFASPKRAWQLSKTPKDEWLLWTQSYRNNEGIFVSYGLAKQAQFWQGYVFAKTSQQLAEQLANRLIELAQLGIFLPENTTLDITRLNAMIKHAPDDADLLLLLAQHYLDIKQYDVALTYAQKLANISSGFSDSPYRVKAQWLMAEIYSKRHKYQLANHALNNMVTSLENTSLWPLRFDHIKTSAWLAKAQADFDNMFSILDQGIEFGANQGDHLLAFELHILYSILAKKAGDDHKKYAYLNEAQALLLKHKLDESNFAVVYYHFAIFSKDTRNAVPYFEKILQLPRTVNNAWIIDHSTELLIDQYIKRHDFQLALTLLADLEGSAKYMLSMARIYHAQQAPLKARTHFEKAFELARLNYEVHIGIDSALMLYQLTTEQPQQQAQYLDYLKRNANEAWLAGKLTEIAAK